MSTFLDPDQIASRYPGDGIGCPTAVERLVVAVACDTLWRMDNLLTREKLVAFLSQLGGKARSRGACYLTGGASALLVGWRETTLDVDLKFDPEPLGVFDAIPELKKSLQINVELASPDDFIPVPADWKSNSPFVGQYGELSVYHFDFTAQALSKIERGHPKDLLDVREMLRRGLTSKDQLFTMLQAIRPLVRRYPAIDEETFVSRIESFVREA